MKTNHILVDYENVQPASLEALNADHIRLLVFVGATQTKISLPLAIAIQQMGARAEYIQISGSGANALDFHIAFTIGRLAAVEPDAYFHIISKDTGFDPLIEHLKHKHIRACRSCCVADLPFLKAAQPGTTAAQVAAVVASLHRRGAAKPKTVKTLTSTVAALFGQQLSDTETAALLKHLEKRGFITVTDTKVAYALPPAE